MEPGVATPEPGAALAAPDPGPELAGNPRSSTSPSVAAEILAIPLGPRSLIAMSLDLLTRSDSGLRSASFYIGFILLVTVAPAVVLGVAVALAVSFDAPDPFSDPVFTSGSIAWLELAAVPALLGYLVAGVEARALATAVIGGRAEGRPLALRQSIAIVRKRFWPVVVVVALLGVASSLAEQAVLSIIVALVPGWATAFALLISTVVGLLVTLPFVYATAGIVLGEVGPLEGLARSVRLTRARPRLALIVTMFGIISQFVVLFGISAGGDTVARLVEGAGFAESIPLILAVVIAIPFVFAVGTLLFLVEAIAAAPQVYAFEALTHYTRGLELGREQPLARRRPWEPFLSRGLVLGATVGIVAMVVGLLTIPS